MMKSVLFLNFQHMHSPFLSLVHPCMFPFVEFPLASISPVFFHGVFYELGWRIEKPRCFSENCFHAIFCERRTIL
jgi:hypothetical protein